MWDSSGGCGRFYPIYNGGGLLFSGGGGGLLFSGGGGGLLFNFGGGGLIFISSSSPSHSPCGQTTRGWQGKKHLRFGGGVFEREFPAVFNAAKDLPPVIHHVQHHIETTGRPVASKYRRLDPAKLKAAKAEFREMERQGVIRRSSSNWASPLHMVKKADGSWRPCGDFRQLNTQTKPDRYTCPNISDLTARLAGCHVFSKLDLRKGYHQVPVRPEDVCKTAVVTPFGLFEFIRMAFGLCGAGQTFQRMMDEVLVDLEFFFCYMDDILVASRNMEQHQQHLPPAEAWSGAKCREV